MRRARNRSAISYAARGVVGHAGNPDQVCRRVEVDWLDVLVENLDVHIRGHGRGNGLAGEHGEAEDARRARLVAGFGPPGRAKSD